MEFASTWRDGPFCRYRRSRRFQHQKGVQWISNLKTGNSGRGRRPSTASMCSSVTLPTKMREALEQIEKLLLDEAKFADEMTNNGEHK